MAGAELRACHDRYETNLSCGGFSETFCHAPCGTNCSRQPGGSTSELLGEREEHESCRWTVEASRSQHLATAFPWRTGLRFAIRRGVAKPGYRTCFGTIQPPSAVGRTRLSTEPASDGPPIILRFANGCGYSRARRARTRPCRAAEGDGASQTGDLGRLGAPASSASRTERCAARVGPHARPGNVRCLLWPTAIDGWAMPRGHAPRVKPLRGVKRS